MGNMKSLFHPDLWVGSVTDIQSAPLQGKGIRGLILDLDETLVAALAHTPTAAVHTWIDEMKSQFSLFILSNNKSGVRVQKVAELLDVPCSHLAMKPRRKGFRAALFAMGLQANEVAIIGDQVFTDVLGGNLLGSFTILATPIAPEHKAWRKIMRLAEAMFIRKLKVVRDLVQKEPT